ncbi:MAG: ABC transporter permease [Candidatus Margulisiibacteriota bacterium]
MTNKAANSKEYIISSSERRSLINLSELWRYRELFGVLSWRDLSVRYKQTILGILWAIFQPFATMIIFTFIFNNLANIQSGDGTPYPIFIYIGLLLWQLFSGIIKDSSQSLTSNANLIQKIYFPRIIIPSSVVLTALVDFICGSIILVFLMVWYGFAPHLIGLLILPVLIICSISSAMGIGLFLSALNVKYRDVSHIVPFFIQLLLFVTPVIYPIKILAGFNFIKTLMIWLNPMAGIIDCARAGIIGKSMVDWNALIISIVVSLLMFSLGLLYFKRTENYFADNI